MLIIKDFLHLSTKETKKQDSDMLESKSTSSEVFYFDKKYTNIQITGLVMKWVTHIVKI